MPGRIPSLHGLRAIAVTLVIVGHVLEPDPADRGYSFIQPLAGIGVTLFFSISGFLITTLLLRESEMTGSIHLRLFYARRAIRLWPALWTFLLVCVVLDLVGSLEVTPREILAAVFFVTDYVRPEHPATGHTWSLSVEEQFYLLWPLLLLWIGRDRAPKVLAVGILMTPLVRIATHVAVPEWRGEATFQFHQRYDALAAGCLLALLWSNPRVIRVLTDRTGSVLALGIALVVLPEIALNLVGSSAGFLGSTVAAIGFALIVGAAIHLRPAALNSRVAEHIGLISYSLYLYQQLFVLESGRVVESALLGLVLVLAAAELSYWLTERPFESLRRGLAAPRAGASSG